MFSSREPVLALPSFVCFTSMSNYHADIEFSCVI
jgi:hypothetical protein